MSRKTGMIIGLGAILLLAVWLCAIKQKRLTPLDLYNKAVFTRPTQLSSSATDFGIFIAGIDALDGTPTVACNQKVSITFTSPPLSPGVWDAVLIVPRLLEQGKLGFEYIDPNCDLSLGLSSPGEKTLGDGRLCNLQAEFRLKPGNYVTRIYRYIQNIDPEQGSPRHEFLGEGRLRVIPSDSTMSSFVPLENNQSLMPLFRPENEDIQ